MYGSMRVILESILKQKFSQEYEWYGILFRCSWRRRIKIFFGQIKKGARSSEFEIAIQWLLDCGLVYKVNRVNEPHMPLKAYKNMNAYKLFVLDVGLLGAMSELPAESILRVTIFLLNLKARLQNSTFCSS